MQGHCSGVGALMAIMTHHDVDLPMKSFDMMKWLRSVIVWVPTRCLQSQDSHTSHTDLEGTQRNRGRSFEHGITSR